METANIIIVNIPRLVKDRAKNMELYLIKKADIGTFLQIVNINDCLNPMNYT